jgi:hypothetical protein
MSYLLRRCTVADSTLLLAFMMRRSASHVLIWLAARQFSKSATERSYSRRAAWSDLFVAHAASTPAPTTIAAVTAKRVLIETMQIAGASFHFFGEIAKRNSPRA